MILKTVLNSSNFQIPLTHTWGDKLNKMKLIVSILSMNNFRIRKSDLHYFQPLRQLIVSQDKWILQGLFLICRKYLNIDQNSIIFKQRQSCYLFWICLLILSLYFHCFLMHFIEKDRIFPMMIFFELIIYHHIILEKRINKITSLKLLKLCQRFFSFKTKLQIIILIANKLVNVVFIRNKLRQDRLLLMKDKHIFFTIRNKSKIHVCILNA